MDILAARKKAAERARAAKPSGPEPEEVAVPAKPDTAPADESVAEEQRAREHVDQIESAEIPGSDAGPPPIPDTSVVPDEPVPATEKQPAAARESELSLTKKADARETAPQPEQLEQLQEHDLEVLSFLLGTEEYVVPVERVREVLTPKEITPVPHAADYLLGVCSLRGTVMPVIDLNRRLGLAASPRDEKSRIIVVSLAQDDQVGLFVDRVRGVVRLLPSAVRPTPDTVAHGAGAEFLKGIARKDDRLYILLDVEKAVGS